MKGGNAAEFGLRVGEVGELVARVAVTERLCVESESAKGVDVAAKEGEELGVFEGVGRVVEAVGERRGGGEEDGRGKGGRRATLAKKGVGDQARFSIL